ADWSRNLLAVLLPARAGVRMTLPGEIDWRVLALSAGASLFVMVIFGLIPAMQTSRINVASALKSEANSIVGDRSRAWIRSGFVLVQIALSFILLVGAALLIQSNRGIQGTDLGFSTNNVIATYVDLRSAGYDAASAANFRDALLDRLESVPGLESA